VIAVQAVRADVALADAPHDTTPTPGLPCRAPPTSQRAQRPRV
jgi:hypothetical protein